MAAVTIRVDDMVKQQAETLQAMLESEMLMNDPDTKTYNSFSEIMEEIHTNVPKSDDIFCRQLYNDYLNDTDPEKDKTIPLNKLADELGIVLDDVQG